MIRGLLIFALLGITLASRSANQYVENVIQTSLQNELRVLGLNPAPLPNFDVSLGGNAQASFVNGNATGLIFAKRQSDCQGPKLFRGELTINCTLSLYRITTNYGVRVRNGSRITNARGVATVGETLIYVVISGQPQNYVGSVKNFQVQRVGAVNPKFSGLPPAASKYVKVMQDYYKSYVSSQLYNILQQRFVYALGRALAYKPMPRQ